MEDEWVDIVQDWCSFFPEYVQKVYIGGCCKLHDLTLSTSRFYRCLRQKTRHLKYSREWSRLIVTGGFLGAWFFHPIKMFKRLVK